MRVFAAGIHVQVLHLCTLQGAASDHALDRLAHDVAGVLASQALGDRTFLDPTGITGVIMEQLLVHLVAGQADLLGIDDDDIVATINMRGELGLVLAAQALGNDGGQTTQNEALGVDQVQPRVTSAGFSESVVFMDSVFRPVM